MKKCILFFSILFISPLLFGKNTLGLVPLPNHIEMHEGRFSFNEKTQWTVENEKQKAIASFLTNRFSRTCGWNPSIKTSGKIKKNSVCFQTNASLPEEAYELIIQKENVLLKASSEKGFFYGIQTLLQLLPPEIHSGQTVRTAHWDIPCLSISDRPRFGYRGFMLDVSRYFMPKEDVLCFIDYLAFHKINTFHWHLTDDNGWRIEIKKYPELTDISAWRVERHNNFPLRSNPEPGEAPVRGGYYSQEDIKEVIRYAQERFIEIIPEIEMPAHTNASLAAFPQLACPVIEDYIGVLPGGGGRNSANIYCAGNDSVFRFLEDVLTEVIALFPSRYVHIGGDEAEKRNWKKCPKCQARMRENNIPNEEELQSYFIRRINRFLISKGKKLMGWDELVDSEIPEGATIFGWRGPGTAGERAGELKFNYIKCPALKYYLTRYQGPQWFEPFTYFGNITLKDIYTYEPKPATLPDSVGQYMLGVEACLWNEFVNNTAEAEYQLFPRFIAFSETAWTFPENKSWDHFISRLDNILESYDRMGINYAKSMYNIEHCVRPVNGKLEVELSNIRPDLEIRYTTDGSEPKGDSRLYNGKFRIDPGSTVRAASFMNNKRMGEILPLQPVSHKATGCRVESAKTSAYVLTNGLRGSEKMTDGEWLDFYDCDGEFTIDLGKPTDCSVIYAGMLNNAGMGIHLPQSITIERSNNGTDFTPFFQQTYNAPERFQNGFFKTTEIYRFDPLTTRYLRFKVQNPGIVPERLIRAGQKTRMVFDEVIVY